MTKLLKLLRNITLSKFIFLAIGVTVLLVSMNLNESKDHWKNTLGADAKGYYAYLPAVFIYHDLNLGFFDYIEKEKYYLPKKYYDYRSGANGKVINKYYPGTAVLQLPFFTCAHFYALAGFAEADGYSKPYIISVCLAAWFYLLLGLFYLRKSLLLLNINEKIIALTLIATIFGTNLFYYATAEPGLSHVFSFAIISTFGYLILKQYNTYLSERWWLIGLLFGLIFIVRPVNVLALLLIPALATNWKQFTSFLKQIHSKEWMKIAIATFIPVLILFTVNYFSAGEFLIYSYGDEKFNFLDPHLVDILFSYRKGLFLYTPFYLFALILLFLDKNKFRITALLLFFLVLTYVFSSWWMWYYGGSFSSRVYIDFLFIFALCFANGYQSSRKHWSKKLIFGLTMVLIVLCQIQTYQYRYYQIHWSDMTKEKYWENFLRIDKLL